MAGRDDIFTLRGQMAEVRSRMADLLAAERPDDSTARELLANRLETLEKNLLTMLGSRDPAPADGGLGAILGIGPEASAPLGNVSSPGPVPSYDEAVASERLYAVGDLYYCYQLERLGVFRAINKLKELFRAGTLRLASGQGAFNLYRFDRREVLRSTHLERMQAYKRGFGYTDVAPPRGSKPNVAFHSMFSQFNLKVAQLFRDKRIADTFRSGGLATQASFGSIAATRRAGLDLRQNLKRASYGDINVLTVELLQLVSSAFEILGADDIRHQFGTDNGWDTLEEVLQRYLGETPAVSQRSRMGETGRNIIHWLAQSYILTSGRTAFEALVQAIEDDCEEWITSAQALGGGVERAAQPRSAPNVVAFPARGRMRA